MQRAAAILCMLLLGSVVACVESASVICPSGLICPARSVCDDVSDRCISVEQLEACAGGVDGDECLVSGLSGTCLGGVCEIASCGNNQLELGEVCDDGNRQDLDGCRNDCQSNERCGNGIIDFQVGEQCDCGDGTVAAPGCTTANSDAGGLCRTDCRLRCGDGVVAANEQCEGRPRPFETCTLWQFDLGSLGCEQCGFDYATCHHIGWHAVVDGFDITTIWGSAADNVFAGGSRGDPGVILHFDGSAWTFAEFEGRVVDIDGVGANDVFAVATPMSGSQIWHYDGTTWTLTPWPSTVSQTMRAVWSRGGGGAIAVGDVGQIYEYNGAAWTKMTTVALTGASLRDVWGAAANDVWAVGAPGAVAHFTGGSGGWSPITIPALAGETAVAIEGISADDILIGGGRKLVRGNAGGWIDISPPDVQDIQGIWARSAADIYVVDGSGRVLRRRGTQWIEHVVSPPAGMRDVWGVADHVFAAASDGVRDHTGLAWRKPLPRPADALSLRGLFATGADNFYATSQNGSMGYDVLHWDGQSWSAASFSDPPNDVWATGDNVVVVGDSGTILQGTGLALSQVTSNTTANLLAVGGASASDVVAVGESGAIVQYNGTTWSLAASATASTLRDVWVGAGLAVAVGAQGTIVHRTSSGWTAQASPTTAELVAVWGAGPNLVYAVGSDGSLLRYDGAAWVIEAALFGVTGLSAIAGTGPDDIFVVGYRSVFHRDALGWAPVRQRASPALTSWTAVAVLPDSVMMLGADLEIDRLERE